MGLADRQLRIGVVGAGMISEYHLRGWRTTDGARVVAICDPVLERARQRAQAFGVSEVFTDLDSMLDRVGIDAVDIVTPVGTHAALVAAAADRGIHVMCQKPMAPTVAEAERLIEQVGDRVRFMVHENYRFQPQYVRAREWLNEGRIGRPLQVRMATRCSGMCKHEGTPWLVERQPYLATLPRLLVFETLIHHLDTLRSLIGELEVVSCYLGHINNDLVGEDTALIVLRGEPDLLITLDGTFSAPGYTPQIADRLEIIGEHGTMVFDGERLFLVGRQEEAIVYRSAGAKEEGQECFSTSIRYFVDGVLGGAPFPTDRLDNLKTLRLMESCYTSARTSTRT
jgi:D-apiose dehydrogenase